MAEESRLNRLVNLRNAYGRPIAIVVGQEITVASPYFRKALDDSGLSEFLPDPDQWADMLAAWTLVECSGESDLSDLTNF